MYSCFPFVNTFLLYVFCSASPASEGLYQGICCFLLYCSRTDLRTPLPIPAKDDLRPDCVHRLRRLSNISHTSATSASEHIRAPYCWIESTAVPV